MRGKRNLKKKYRLIYGCLTCVLCSVTQSVHCNVEDPQDGDMTLIEIRAVVRLTLFLQSNAAADTRRRLQIVGEINDIVHRGIHSQADLIACKVGQSILCYFFCKSEAALLYLHVTNENGRLKKALRMIFRLVLGHSGDINVLRTSTSLTVSKLRLRMAELRKDLGELRR